MSDKGCKTWQVAVVGGGPAGLTAALSAAFTRADSEQAAAAVLVLEKQDRVGRKLLATGNGQCNLSHADATGNLLHYHGQDCHFADKAFQMLDVEKTRDFFRRIGLVLRTEQDGRIYPYSRQASAVLDVLRLACAALGIRILTSFAVSEIKPVQLPGQTKCFVISSADGRVVRALNVVLASGGLAAPHLGAEESGYELMRQLGHRITACFPSLVPIRTETDFVRGLAGIKFDGLAVVESGGRHLAAAAGEILLTEYGLSGPPILQISRCVAELTQKKPAYPVQIVLDMLPDMPGDELLSWLTYKREVNPDSSLADYLTGLVNKKVGQAVIKRCLAYPLNRTVSLINKDNLSKLAACLKAWPVRVTGSRDWHQAQVTAGGLDTRDFCPANLESRRVPGLFAAGEVLDIDGDCGGYNLQWAWSSGFLAGRRAMAASLEARIE